MQQYVVFGIQIMSMQIKTRNSYEPVIAHLSIHRIEQSGLDFEKKNTLIMKRTLKQ